MGEAELNGLNGRLNRVGITVTWTDRGASGRAFVARFSTERSAKEHGVTKGRFDKTGRGWGHAGMRMALGRLVHGAENGAAKGPGILKDLADKPPQVRARIAATVRAIAGELPADEPARRQMLDAVEGL